MSEETEEEHRTGQGSYVMEPRSHALPPESI